MKPTRPHLPHLATMLLALLLLAACSRYVPVDATLEAAPDRIVAGESTTLTWAVHTNPAGALPRPGSVPYQAVLEPGSIDVTHRTTITVSPEATTTYELIVQWAGQELRSEATIEVDARPVATPDTYVAERGATLDVAAAAGVLTNDADPEGATLTAELVDGPAHGTLELAGDGSFRYTNDGDPATSDSFRYRATADGVLSEPVEVTLDVVEGNEAPTGTNASFTVDEDDSLAIDLAPLFTDVDGDALTYSVATAPTLGTASIDGSILTYTPAADANGANTIIVEAADGTVATRATLSIDVRPVNDAPVGTDSSVAMDEDGSVDVDLTTLFTDVDGDILTYSVATAPTLGLASITGSTLTFTPTADANGADTLVVEASDADASATATLTLDVRPVNDAPVAGDETFAAFPGDPLDVDLAAIASDVDGDALSFRIVSGPTRGTAVVTGSTLTFTPLADATGSDAITLEASDGAAATEFTLSFDLGGIITDPIGDFSYDLDLVELRWYADGSDVVFEIELTQAALASPYMDLDLDRDPSTGYSNAVERYCVDAPASAYEVGVHIHSGSVIDLAAGTTLGTAAVTLAGTVTTVRFPTAWIGGDLALDPYIVVGQMGPSDCIPGRTGAYLP